VGEAVSRFRPGDRVFGYGPVREEHQRTRSSSGRWDGLSEVDAVCSDPAHVALVAVRDGNVRVGDHVAVYGLGAIACWRCRWRAGRGAAGVCRGSRRPAARDALAHGAEAAFEPRDGDTALAIKLATGKQVSTWRWRLPAMPARCRTRSAASGSAAPWSTCRGDRRTASALRLDEEFHLNRPTLVGSQAVWNNPDRSHPLWTQRRAQEAAIELLRSGLITGEGIVDGRLSLSRRPPPSWGELLHAPDRAIKVGSPSPRREEPPS